MACTNHYITTGNRDGHWIGADSFSVGLALRSSFNFISCGRSHGIPFFDSYSLSHSFYLFSHVIPSDFDIIAAKLTLQAYETLSLSEPPIYARIYAIAQNNLVAPVLYSDCDAWNLTSAYTDWTLPVTLTLGDIVELDVRNQVQEVVRNYTGLLGIVIKILYPGQVGSGNLRFTSFESNLVNAPTLCIEAQAPTGKGSIRVRDEIYYVSDIRDR